MSQLINLKKIKEILNKDVNQCPVERAMRILGGKWKASILFHLVEKPMRFNALASSLPNASKKILTQRLQEMEELGLVQRKVLATKPIAVEYSITDAGKEAFAALESIKNWGIKNNI